MISEKEKEKAAAWLLCFRGLPLLAHFRQEFIVILVLGFLYIRRMRNWCIKTLVKRITHRAVSSSHKVILIHKYQFLTFVGYYYTSVSPLL